MQRREFLKKSAAATAAASFTGPAILGASDKAGVRNPIIGQGDHRYECVHDPFKLPGEQVWETTHGVCVDEAGLVYIKQQGHGNKPARDTIYVFEPKGQFVRSFGKDIHPGGHGIDLRKEGGEQFLYLCDTAHGQVIKTNLRGDVVWRLRTPEQARTDNGKPVYDAKRVYRPTNLAFAPDGGFYVGDGYGQHYIHQYDKEAKWVRSWGGFGDAPGKMKTPHGIWLDDRPGHEPSLIVADRANARLQYFSLDGQHQKFVQDVLFPAHFDIRGDLLLVPDLHARVTLLDRNNKTIVHLGDDPAWRKTVLDGFKVRRDPGAWVPGKFVHPHDACFDRDGNILVVEWVETGRVTLLRRV